jgi:hypothetical protein
MFERLNAHGRALAERRRKALTARLTDGLKAELPHGIGAEAVPEGIRLSGKGLARRFATEPALRWLTVGWGT